jgi:hypothetical protein
MTINSDELVKALHENLKLRRQLATEVAGANGEKLAAVRYRSTRLYGTLRHAFSGRIRRAPMSAAVVELMRLDGAREQYAAQLRQLDSAKGDCTVAAAPHGSATPKRPVK